MAIGFESDADRLAMIAALGGGDVEAPNGFFTGLLETEFVQVGEVPVDSYLPRLSARTIDIEAAEVDVGVELTIEEQTYVVRSVQNDRTGMTVLVLEET